MAKLLNIVGLSSKFIKPSFNFSSSLYKTTKNTIQFQHVLKQSNFRSFASVNSRFDKLVEDAKQDLIKDKDGNYKLKSGSSSLDNFNSDKIDFSDDQLTADLLDEVRDGKITSKELEQMYQNNYQDEESLKDYAARQFVLLDKADQLSSEDSTSVAVAGQEGEEYTYDYDYDNDEAEGLSELELSESEDEEAILKQKKDAEAAQTEKQNKYMTFVNGEVSKLANFHRERAILRSAIVQAKQIEKNGEVKPVKEEEEAPEQAEEEEVDPEIKHLQVQSNQLENVNVDQFINRFKDVNSNFSILEKELDLSQTQEQQLAKLNEVIPKLKGTNEEKDALKKAYVEELSQYHKTKDAIRKSFQQKAAQIKDNSVFRTVPFEKYN